MQTMTSINSAVAAEVSTPMDSSGIGGHPRGLTTLFFTEMWERFSYYGMRAILILYMVAAPTSGGLGFDTAKAAAIYGAYTSAAYLTAVPGGWVADRFLGARSAVLYGGILIALGHFSMALGPLSFFFAGMILIVIGTGLLKPNISTMVGGLYSENDPRRDAGFSVFYMGINLGALISPLVCGYLGQRVDWHLGFGAAGIGMSLGLVQFLAHRERLAHVGNKPDKLHRKEMAALGEGLTAGEMKRLAAIGILFVFSSIFWAAFEQAGSSLNLFADQVTDNRVLGWEFPSSWFQSVNSIFLIALAPVFSWLWLRMGDRQPSSPAKFSYGLLFVGLGFILAALGASVADNGKVSPAWLIGVYLFNTTGELCLSPVGLSTVTKLAPARLVGLMMGVWFLSISTGNYLGGWIAGFYDAAAEGAMVRLFGAVAMGTLVAAAILAWLIPFIRSLMGRVR
jgi:proton-dependent oligopeptide transporter, POT family